MAEALAIIGGRQNLIVEVAMTHGYKSLKEEQLLAIQDFVWGKDVFVSLPSGFGVTYLRTFDASNRSYQRARNCNIGP